MSNPNGGLAMISGTRLRIGFKGRNQLPWFMIWLEYWDGGEVVFARVLFKI